MPNEPFVIDVRTRDTESGWQRRIDWFYLTVTPAWFTWLGWVALLSALRFVSDASPQLRWLGIAVWASHFLLVMYFVALFQRLRLIGIPKLSEWGHLLVSGLLGGAAALVAAFASGKIASALAVATVR